MSIINTDNTVNTDKAGDKMKIILRGKENVYEQLVKEYKRFIELGIIKKDEKMPSCRELAKELGINPNTVVRSYDILEQLGYITTLHKKGAYVIYEKKENQNEQKINEIKVQLASIKEVISYNELLNIINKLYGRE